jgi:hypothetical protein
MRMMMLIGAGLASVALSAGPAHAAESRHTRAEPAGDPAPPGPPPAPPHVFLAAGYSQPDITPGLCETRGPKETRCVIPEMTAGRYVIVASGSSTATEEGAAQAIDIRLVSGGEEQICARAQTNTAKGGKPWSAGARTIRVACIVQIISDDKLVVRATYADSHATPDGKGPVLAFRKVAWSPIWNAVAAPVQVAAPPAAPAEEK